MKPLYVFLFVLPFFGKTQQHNSTPEPFSLGSVGCWDFDGNTLDHSGNNNHGTGTNIVYVPNRFNQPNTAAYFNGTSSKVVVPHSATIDFTTGVSFSFTYWQKTYPGNVGKVIISKHTYGNWDGYNFIANNQGNSGYCTTTDHMYWYVAAGYQEDACSDAAVLSDTAWHFIAGLYDAPNNKTYLYVDAVQQNDVGQASGTASTSADLSFGFDVDINGLFFHGVLDDACLYPRLLTQTEIQNMYGVPASIDDNDMSSRVTVYPNPASGEFSLILPERHNLHRGEIFNQMGQRVLTFQINAGTDKIHASLPEGLYFITLSNDAGTCVNEKLLISR